MERLHCVTNFSVTTGYRYRSIVPVQLTILVAYHSVGTLGRKTGEHGTREWHVKQHEAS